MKTKHHLIEKVSMLFVVVCCLLTFSSCDNSKSNIIASIITLDKEIAEIFNIEDLEFKGDTVKFKVYVNTDSPEFKNDSADASQGWKENLEKTKEYLREEGYGDSYIDHTFMFSTLTDKGCIFTNSFNVIAAVKTAKYFNEVKDSADRVISTDFYDSKDDKFLSTLNIPKKSYHEIQNLINLKFSDMLIIQTFSFILNHENGVKEVISKLPQVIDEYTTLYKVEINDNTYDYYYKSPKFIMELLDEEVMNEICINISNSLEKTNDSNSLTEIWECLKALNKKYVYHYYDDCGREYYRVYVDIPNYKSYRCSKVSE